MSDKQTVLFEVIKGVAGPSLYIGDGRAGHRLAGSKPWGGGRVVHTFAVDMDELLREALALGPSLALHDVAVERARQVGDKGYSYERDDGYTQQELADAGAQYALAAGGWPNLDVYPWKPETFKHGTPREMLVKAAALLIAEIERLDRAAGMKDA